MPKNQQKKAPPRIGGVWGGSKKTKNKIIIAIAITIGLAAFMSYKPRSYSASDLTYGTGTIDCRMSFMNGRDILRKAWESNLNSLLSQPKASSDMVDEAFESMRTYRCWLGYLCDSVKFSAFAPAGAGATFLNSSEVPTIPGCVPIDKVDLTPAWTAAWPTVVNTLAQKINQVSAYTSSATPVNGFTYIPQCFLDPPNFSTAQFVYDNCQNVMNTEFNGGTGSAFIELQSVLTKTAAKQHASALENKLDSILNKMVGMQANGEYMKTEFGKLDSLMKCYASSCD